MHAEPKRRRWPKLLAGTLVVLAALGVSLFFYWKWKYPYGWSHCCIKNMGVALRLYWTDNDSHSPAGGDTPEASLSLLYSNYVDAYWLRGKTVPLEVVQAALARSGKLGPDSCGWQYVEGLNEGDDLELAILWDKVGLDHYGGRVKGGGHEVMFMDGSTRFIPGAQWPEFLEKQKKLLAQRDERARQGVPALTARIHFPDGTEVSEYDGPYKLYTGSGYESGGRTQLRWMHFFQSDGPCTLTLELPGKRLRSKPVTVQVSSRRATPDTIVFEMEPY